MKKTLLILTVLFASVSSGFAQYSAHGNISWTGSTYFNGGGSWILVQGDPYNPNNWDSQNIQLNINSNLYALEYYGYTLQTASAGNWVYLNSYSSNSSYGYEFDTGYTPSSDHIEIRHLFYDSNNPIYVDTLNIFFAAGGNSAGRLIVNWAATWW